MAEEKKKEKQIKIDKSMIRLPMPSIASYMLYLMLYERNK